MASRNNLISDTNTVQVPQVIAKIGNYEFGSYSKVGGHTKYPNYIQSLRVTKINGQVNTYELSLVYLITEFNDPNYFEKVFASVSQDRKIYFTYGDCAQKNFMYRNEEALITKISSNFNAEGASISYTVHAVSAATLATSGSYDFPAVYDKPSNVIYQILRNNNKFGLQDLFRGMRDVELCQAKHLIATTDIAINIPAATNMSVLDYLQFLVDNMTRSQGTSSNVAKSSFYVLKYVDDTTDTFHGPYFQVIEVDAAIQHPEAYVLDYGFPSSNLVRDLRIENNENYSIYYDYQSTLHPQEYVSRINAAGEYEEVFAPILSSANSSRTTKEKERAWWTKVSQYPIRASVTIKGLLRPAVLMSYLRLNVLFFGKKHITSGLYIITKQQDTIDGNGFSTQLDLVKVAGDESEATIW